MPTEINTVVVDEIQRLPVLLDTIQSYIQQQKFRFVLTGSSARKLKRGHANLLGGRAVVRYLWPLVHTEIPEAQFHLNDALSWGLLPKVYLTQQNEDKTDLLRTYVQTYLSEEIVAEQLVRNLDPFRKFLSIAAQMNGKIINASKLAKDVRSNHNTVQSYFEILEDTLIGFLLPAFDTSIRKQVRKKPKFFLFDTGVARALAKFLEVPLLERTSYYGDVFEHFIISELFKICSYEKPDWTMSYLSTKDNAEIDVIIERPGQKHILIEIKSSKTLDAVELVTTLKLMEDFGDAECFIFSQDRFVRQIGIAKAVPWREGFQKIFSPEVDK